MIRIWFGVVGLVAVLAGCSSSRAPSSFGEDEPVANISLSGTAVTGVAGGSGQSAQMVSGIKDLDLSVGVNLGGR